MSSLVYHLYPPTRVKQKGKPYSVVPEIAIENSLNALSFKGFEMKPENDFLESLTDSSVLRKEAFAAPRH